MNYKVLVSEQAARDLNGIYSRGDVWIKERTSVYHRGSFVKGDFRWSLPRTCYGAGMTSSVGGLMRPFGSYAEISWSFLPLHSKTIECIFASTGPLAPLAEVSQSGHCDFRVLDRWRSAPCRAFLWKPSRCWDSFLFVGCLINCQTIVTQGSS